MVTVLELVINALRTVTGVPVVSLVPVARPPVFVRVEQAAPSAISPAHDRVMIIVEVYGQHPRLEQVLDIVATCRDYLRFQLDHDVPQIVGYSEVSGPVEFPDPDIAETHTRWQIVGNVIHALA